ncbi:hypothetical protein N7476_004741, partial [Penicillium atrosanguineum]
MGSISLQLILQRLLDSGRYSDLTISCGEKNFQVHRAIVCSQSSFFDAAVKGGFKEAYLSHVDLPDDELGTIQRVVSFLYLQDYQETDESHSEIRDSDSMWNNLGVFMAADKFDISILKDFARSRIIKWIDTNAIKSPLNVRNIWTTLPPHETQLRDAIVRSISCDVQQFLIYDGSMEAMESLPDMTIA